MWLFVNNPHICYESLSQVFALAPAWVWRGLPKAVLLAVAGEWQQMWIVKRCLVH